LNSISAAIRKVINKKPSRNVLKTFNKQPTVRHSAMAARSSWQGNERQLYGSKQLLADQQLNSSVCCFAFNEMSMNFCSQKIDFYIQNFSIFAKVVGNNSWATKFRQRTAFN